MDDEWLAEILHREFMDTVNQLAAAIFSSYMRADAETTLEGWSDIKTYGDEPVFGSLIFDRMVAEHESGS